MKNILTAIVFILLVLFTAPSHAARFEIANDGPVTAYFLGASAGYTGVLDANFSDSERHTPDDLTNRVAIGQSFDFLNRPAGTEVIFTYHVFDTGKWFYSSKEFNNDGISHMHATQIYMSDGTPAVYVGFEDIYGGGDRDFNDHTAVFTNVVMQPVPEPQSYLMLLVGLILLWLVYTGRVSHAPRNYLQ